MKVVAPEPFTYIGGRKAVLLLHGFTGSTRDVKQLGRYLQDHGYTCHAPLYEGHGRQPSALISTGPKDWWGNVIDGYEFLKTAGFDEIAVVGVSLGAAFSLKLGVDFPVKGIVSMCAPMNVKNTEALFYRVRNYAEGYKRFEGKTKKQITSELNELEQKPMRSLKSLQYFILSMRDKLHQIASPTFVIQGCLDEPLYKESAQFIYENVSAETKLIRYYEHSGHIITLDKEREKVYEEIAHFLNSLKW